MLTVGREAGYQLNRIEAFVLTKRGGTLKENLISRLLTRGWAQKSEVSGNDRFLAQGEKSRYRVVFGVSIGYEQLIKDYQKSWSLFPIPSQILKPNPWRNLIRSTGHQEGLSPRRQESNVPEGLENRRSQKIQGVIAGGLGVRQAPSHSFLFSYILPPSIIVSAHSSVFILVLGLTHVCFSVIFGRCFLLKNTIDTTPISLKWLHDQEGISTEEKFPHRPLLYLHLLHTHSHRPKEQIRALGKGMIYALLSSEQPQKPQ